MTTIYGIYSADASETPTSGLEVVRVGALAALIGSESVGEGRVNLPSDPAQLTQILLEHQTAIHSLNASSILPCKLGAKGLEQIIEINLLADERIALQKSAAAVPELVDILGI